MEGLFFAIVVIVSIVRGLYLFFRAVSRGLSRLTTPTVAAPTPAPTPAPGQRMPQPERPRALAPRPAGTPAVSAKSSAPRRPDAGGSAVPREATTADFRDQEARLEAAEPAPLSAQPGTPATPVEPALSAEIFRSGDDLVRALILQELLAPPLCKRRSPPPG